MRESDFAHFGQMLDAVCSLLSRGAHVPNATSTALWFRALAAYDLAQVRAAFDAHVADPQRGRFVPTPADLIAQIEGAASDDGRPGAEEAWSIAVRAEDEAATVVWTAEIAEAWGIAHPVAHAGDKIGARMAFREAYERLVEAARRERRQVAWSPSLGTDAAARDRAISEAVERGLLSAQAYPTLPAPAVSSLSQLLEGPSAAASGVPQAVLERLAAQREELLRFQRDPPPGVARAEPVQVVFRPIPVECLPPGMRPRPDPEAEYAAQGVQP